MPSTLPFLPGEPNYRIATTLDDIVFVFDVRWNSRDEAWYMDVRTEDGVLIRSAIKIVIGVNLGARVVDSRFPPGVLTALDTTGNDIDAGFDDLGDRVKVFYTTVDELINGTSV